MLLGKRKRPKKRFGRFAFLKSNCTGPEVSEAGRRRRCFRPMDGKRP